METSDWFWTIAIVVAIVWGTRAYFQGEKNRKAFEEEKKRERAAREAERMRKASEELRARERRFRQPITPPLRAPRPLVPVMKSSAKNTLVRQRDQRTFVAPGAESRETDDVFSPTLPIFIPIGGSNAQESTPSPAPVFESGGGGDFGGGGASGSWGSESTSSSSCDSGSSYSSSSSDSGSCSVSSDSY